MAKDFTVTLTENTERGKLFQSIFGTRTVHVKSPIPHLANLPEVGSAYVYELDLKFITAAERDKLVAHISQRFGISPITVDLELDQHGIPILANDCVATIKNPQRWF